MKFDSKMLFLIFGMILTAGLLESAFAASFGSTTSNYQSWERGGAGGCDSPDPMACFSMDFIFSGGNAQFWVMIGVLLLVYYMFYGLIKTVGLFGKHETEERGVAIGLALILFAFPQVRMMLVSLAMPAALFLFAMIMIYILWKGYKHFAEGGIVSQKDLDNITENANKRIDKADKDLRSKAEELEKTKERLGQAEDNAQKLTSDLSTREIELNAEKEKLKTANDQIAGLEDRLKTANETEIPRIQSQLNQAMQDKTAAEKKIGELDGQVITLNKTIEATQQEKDKYVKELEKERVRIKADEEQIAKAEKEEVDKLRYALSNEDAYINNQENKVHALEKDVDKLKEKIEKMEQMTTDVHKPNCTPQLKADLLNKINELNVAKTKHTQAIEKRTEIDRKIKEAEAKAGEIRAEEEGMLNFIPAGR